MGQQNRINENCEPIGALQWFPTTNTDVYTNWLPCNGQTLSQSAYPKLFSTIGLLNGPGSNWKYIPVTSTQISSLLYGGSLFVAATVLGGIYTSTDATTVTSQKSGTSSS